MRWAEALHPAAFLIDQHRGIGPADYFAKLAHQISDLLRIVDVALE